MAKVDSRLRSAPYVGMDSLKSCILYRNNDTADWLQDQTSDTRKDVISTAMHTKRRRTEEKNDRKEQLRKAHLKIISDRELGAKRKKAKELEAKETAISNLDTIGFLNSETKIDDALDKCKTKREKYPF